MVNKVILVGRLGRDPEARFLPDGRPVAQFSRATVRTWRDEVNEKHSETDWHTIVARGRLKSAYSIWPKAILRTWKDGSKPASGKRTW